MPIVQTIIEICTEITMQVLKVSEGPFQPAGFGRNQEAFCAIGDFKEENNAQDHVLESTVIDPSRYLINSVTDKMKMITRSAKTSYSDCDSARTGAMMSQDLPVVPTHGCSLSGTSKYSYHRVK